MATRLDDRPDQDSKEKSQEDIDREFEELTSDEHMAQDGESPDLSDQESNPRSEDSSADDFAANELPHNGDFDYSSELKKEKFSFRRRRKQLAVGAGIVGIIAGIMGSLFVFLPSLKVTHILNNLEDRFYGVAANAIEARAEHLLSRYMRNYTFKALKDCGVVVSKGCSSTSGLGGSSIAGRLFNTWRDASIEEKLFTSHGIEMEWRGGNDYSITTKTGTSIVVDGETFEFEELRRRNDASAREVRRELRNTMKNETHWYQLMYRRSIRNLASRKYNIRWCVFACEVRDNAREARISALQKLKLKIIERTIGPFSDRLGIYFTCAVTDCSNREFVAERTRIINQAVAELGEETVQEIIDEFKANDGKPNHRLSQVFVKKIVSKFATQATGTAVAGTIPVVGWLYIIDAINQIDKQLYVGAISQFLSDNVASQYAEFYLTYKTNYDEGIDGQLVIDEVGAQSQLLDGLERSLVYQRDLGSGAQDSIGFNLFSPAYAQSEQEEYLCADDQPIPEGELVCEERKVGKLSGYDAWRQSETAATVSGLVLGGYRCGPFNIFSVVNADFCEPGSTADTIWFVDGILHGAFSLLNSIFDAVGSFLFNLVPEAVANFIGEIFGKLIQFVLEIAFPFLHVGTGPGRQVFDDLYAGVDVVGNEFAKGFEDPLTGEFVGLGGRKLTDEEIEGNLALLEENRLDEFQSRSLFARLFSPDESKSLLTTVAMSIPTSPGIGGAAQSLASLINPVNLIAQAGGMLISPAYAQGAQYDGDPFGIHQYGYPVDDAMLTIDPEELTPEACSPGGDIYEAWIEGEHEETVEGQVVQDVANPCMLEYVTTNILGCWFTDSDDCGVDNSNVVAPTTEDKGVDGDPSPIPGLVSHPDLGPVLPNGYYQVPPAPNGEYAFWSATPADQRCGSRALVDLAYTISVKWSQLYPGDKILAGDLNAVGHLSHMNGVDWDIWLESSTVGGSFGTNQKAKELGRMLADTGIVKLIFYNVTDVQNDFNTYVQQNNLSGNMSYSDGHFDHFHLRINDEFLGPDSTSCNSSAAAFNFIPIAAKVEDLV